MRCFLFLVILSLLFVGCAHRVEYYEPTPETTIVEEDGSIRGPIKMEETRPDLGTQGLGTYNILPISIF